jgi:hypothetical protein
MRLTALYVVDYIPVAQSYKDSKSAAAQRFLSILSRAFRVSNSISVAIAALPDVADCAPTLTFPDFWTSLWQFFFKLLGSYDPIAFLAHQNP